MVLLTAIIIVFILYTV